MPKRYSVSREIDARPEVVWDLLTDASGYERWNPAVLSIEGTIDAGEKIELVSIVNPKRSFKLRVTEMTAPSKMVWADGMPFGLFKGVRTYLLDDRDGATAFSMTEVFSGPLSGLIVKSIPDMSDSFDQFADGLKAAAEA